MNMNEGRTNGRTGDEVCILLFYANPWDIRYEKKIHPFLKGNLELGVFYASQ
jgi:hypothetical protein